MINEKMNNETKQIWSQSSVDFAHCLGMSTSQHCAAEDSGHTRYPDVGGKVA